MKSFESRSYTDFGVHESAFGGLSREWVINYWTKDNTRSASDLLQEMKKALLVFGKDIKWGSKSGNWIGNYSIGDLTGKANVNIKQNINPNEWFVTVDLIEGTTEQIKYQEWSNKRHAEIEDELWEENRKKNLAFFDKLPKRKELISFFERNPLLKDKVQIMVLTSTGRERHQSELDARKSYSSMRKNLGKDQAKTRVNDFISGMNEHWSEVEKQLPVNANLYLVEFQGKERYFIGYLGLTDTETVYKEHDSMATDRPELEIK